MFCSAQYDEITQDSITLASLDSKNIESKNTHQIVMLSDSETSTKNIESKYDIVLPLAQHDDMTQDSIKLASADTKSNDRILSLNGKIDSTITLANNIESNSQTPTHHPIYNTESNKILTLADNETQTPTNENQTPQSNAQDSNNTQSNTQNSTQTTDAKKSYKLESVVVSASGNEQEYTLAPASISVVTPQEIQSRPVRDLAEALSNVPGVQIDSGVTKTGGFGISIRGMGSGYTLILVDGKRINGDSSLFPNGFGDSVTSFMPPLSAIERIEVIRGPASTLYGSDAIGGVVNIITKKNFDKWGVNFTYDYTAQEKKSFGNTQSFNFYTAGPLNKAKNLGLSLRGRQYTRDFVSSNDLSIVPTINGTTNGASRNNIVGLAPAKIYNIGTRLSYASLDSINNRPKQNAYIDLDYSQQNYDNSQALLGNYANNAADTTEELKQARNGYGAKMNIYRFNAIGAYNNTLIYNAESLLKRLSVDASLQYNMTSNPHRYVPNNTFGQVTNGQLNSGNGVTAGESRGLMGNDAIFDIKSNVDFNIAKWLGINTTWGARYWFNTFSDKLFQAAGSDFVQMQHIGALFGEAEFIFLDRIFLTAGLRGNFNSKFGGNLSPRIYLSYNAINEWLVIKGGVSTGYKTPALSNLVNGVANLSAQGNSHTYGNPNLRPESSINYELSVLSDNEYFSGSLTGFYTDFTNRISTTTAVANGQTINGVVCSANTSCSSYINIGSAISYGLEVSAALKPLKVWLGDISVNLAYTWNKTEVTSAQNQANVGTRLTLIPEHNFNVSLNYDFKSFGFYVREQINAMIYRGDPSVAGSAAAALGEYYKPIYLTHLGGYYKFRDNLRINTAIYNLFDLDFVDYQTYTAASNAQAIANNYNYIREGRRYYIGITMDF